MEHGFLADAVALLVAGAAIAYVCFRLGLVPIVGFLVAGVVIGPSGLGLVHDRALVDAAAEVGVIFLLFTIGIEFSLEKLAQMKTAIFAGGGLQVALASVGMMALLLPVRRRLAERAVHGLPGGAQLDRDRAEAACRPWRDRRAARPHRARHPDLPGPRRGGHGAAGADAGRHRRVGRADRLGTRQGRRHHRGGAGDRAPPHAGGAGAGGAHLLARAVPPHRHRHLPRHRVPHQPGGREPVPGRVPGRTGRQREPVQPACARRDPAAPDPLQRHVLRIGRHAARRGIPADAPAAGGCSASRRCSW